MKIATSLDWITVYFQLTKTLNKAHHRTDLLKMLANIEKMVGELGRLEIDARRTKNFNHVQPQLDKVNEAINYFEKMMLMSLLIK